MSPFIALAHGEYSSMVPSVFGQTPTPSWGSPYKLPASSRRSRRAEELRGPKSLNVTACCNVGFRRTSLRRSSVRRHSLFCFDSSHTRVCDIEVRVDKNPRLRMSSGIQTTRVLWARLCPSLQTLVLRSRYHSYGNA